VRCHPVEIIDFATIGSLVWTLAWSMAGESAAEQRRTKQTTVTDGVARFPNVETKGPQTRRAA
jgi:hypothetical protein